MPSADFLDERIESTKRLIIAYEDAIHNILVGGIESYTLDTGQSKQTVTRHNVEEIQNVLGQLYNQLATIEARKTGGNVIQARAGW